MPSFPHATSSPLMSRSFYINYVAEAPLGRRDSATSSEIKLHSILLQCTWSRTPRLLPYASRTLPFHRMDERPSNGDIALLDSTQAIEMNHIIPGTVDQSSRLPLSKILLIYSVLQLVLFISYMDQTYVICRNGKTLILTAFTRTYRSVSTVLPVISNDLGSADE